MTSKQRISITFVPAGQQAMHERLEREAGIAVDWGGDVHLWWIFTSQISASGTMTT